MFVHLPQGTSSHAANPTVSGRLNLLSRSVGRLAHFWLYFAPIQLKWDRIYAISFLFYMNLGGTLFEIVHDDAGVQNAVPIPSRWQHRATTGGGRRRVAMGRYLGRHGRFRVEIERQSQSDRGESMCDHQPGTRHPFVGVVLRDDIHNSWPLPLSLPVI